MNQLQQVVIIHSRPFRDNSLIVDAFSLELGRISFVAKGIKARNKSEQRMALQMGNLCEVGLTGRSELKTLTQVDIIHTLPRLQGDQFACATYVCELVLRLTHTGQPDESVFNVLKHVFHQLIEPEDQTVALRQFEHTLLLSLGVMISFEYDLQGNPVAAESRYQLRRGEGFIKVNGVTRPEATDEFSGQLILAAANNDSRPETLKFKQKIFWYLLEPHLGNKPLVSRELWRQWAKHQPSG